MTQHILEQDTLEDRKTMRRLAGLVVGFTVATAIMAVVVTLVAG